jgi:hypothetical protein
LTRIQIGEPIGRGARTPQEARDLVANLIDRDPRGRSAIIDRTSKQAELVATTFERYHAGHVVFTYFTPERSQHDLRRLPPRIGD